MNKTSSILLATLLALSALLMIIPIAPTYASTGHASLAYVTPNVTHATLVHDATLSENVTAGILNDTVAQNNVATAAYPFAIDFSNPGVTFSGTQFQLYMSLDGFSHISASDVQYGPTFNVADFSHTAPALKAVTGPLGEGITGTWYIGNVGGTDVVVGPIPLNINSSYSFIKIYDGSTGAVAVTAGTLYPQPGILLSKTSGAPGTPVTVAGGAFPSGLSVDINYTYSSSGWTGANTTTTGTLISGVSTGSGYFTSAATPMVDVMQVIDQKTTNVYTTVPILVYAANDKASTPYVVNSAEMALNLPVFHEFSRGIASISSYSNAGARVGADAFALNHLYGNDTGATGTVGTTTVVDPAVVDANVFGTLYIAGNNSEVGAPVTFLVGSASASVAKSTAMTSAAVTADANGFWNTTVTVPILGLGHHNVWVDQGGVYYNFTINILPTLILNDSVTGAASGPSSNPSSTITVSAYGFPANTVQYLYWTEMAFGDGNAYNVVNGSVGSNGEFTSTVSFAVPNAYGLLPHEVVALSNTTYKFVSVADNASETIKIALAHPVGIEGHGNFTITPTLVVTPGSVNSNDVGTSGWLTATAEGLAPGCNPDGTTPGDNLGYSCNTLLLRLGDSSVIGNFIYTAAIDNNQLPLTSSQGGVTSGLMANGTGDLSFTFPTAGYRPGEHVVTLSNNMAGHQLLEALDRESVNMSTNGIYTFATYAYFNVTTTGDYIYGGFAALNTAISSVSSAVSSLSTTLTSIQTSLTSIQTSLTGISGSITTLTSDVTSLQSSVSGIASQLTSIASAVSGAASSASSAATAAQSAAAAASTAASNTSGIGNTSTYVLVVAVLAAITLVLELAILVRKLS
ncbi:MAG: hypothetical protein JRN27_00165 [Nitrososphaerota archaeon]|nr:hypothetical protein [Nitrososphaerota archaeon]MDG6974494.1 hypothetical protein [Nitrososphaerota archaeon]